jgi:hypothetical protein
MPKRGLTIEEAAEHVGLSVSAFRHWCKRQNVVCRIKGTARYDLKKLDAELDRLSGITTPAAPRDAYEEWEAEWNASQEKRKAEGKA